MPQIHGVRQDRALSAGHGFDGRNVRDCRRLYSLIRRDYQAAEFQERIARQGEGNLAGLRGVDGSVWRIEVSPKLQIPGHLEFVIRNGAGIAWPSPGGDTGTGD